MPRRQTTNSNTYRFFVEPSAFHGDQVLVEDADLIRQISVVLRLVTGDEIVLLDGLGTQYTVAIETLQKHRMTGVVTQREAGAAEPHLHIRLAIGLIRAERFEWLLQKATELGVTTFMPMICERSASDGIVGSAKISRWQRIIREAAEQSRRNRLPQLEQPQPFVSACSQIAGMGILLWEGQGATPLRTILHATRPQTLTILSGPEGGFSDNERAIAHTHTLREATLGPRTLRAETAPLVAATMALYEYGELD